MDPAESVFLPAQVVKAISALAVQDEPNPGSRLLLLLSMCGVCHQWRQLCREVAAETAIAFDGMESAPPAPGGMMLRFRRVPALKKTTVFEAAAKLLTGYSEVSLSGDCVTDDALFAMAATNGPHLISLRLQAAGSVTDAGLSALFSSARRLRHVHLADLGQHVAGSFLPVLLGSCRQLQMLHLNGSPAMDWSVMDWGRIAPAAAEEEAAALAMGGSAAVAIVPSEAGLEVDEQQQQEQQQLPWPESLGAVAAPNSSARGPALSPPASPMQQQQYLSGSAVEEEGGPSGSGNNSSGIARSCDRPRARGIGSSRSSSISSSAVVVTGNGGEGGSRGGGGGSNSSRVSTAALGDAAPAAAAAAAAEAAEAESAAAPAPRQPPALRSLVRLHVRGVRVDGLPRLLALLPSLTDLEIDGPAVNIQFAAVACPELRRLSYLVDAPRDLDEVLWSFTGLANLRALEVVAKGPLLMPDQLRVLGMLPLTELRLDSWAFKQQPTLTRPAFSHVNNEGVKALVDAICARMGNAREPVPLKLSLAGATTINHEAVSALLRLPVLTELDIAGCGKITPMDKMRLVAKVKAGRELLASKKTFGRHRSLMFY